MIDPIRMAGLPNDELETAFVFDTEAEWLLPVGAALAAAQDNPAFGRLIPTDLAGLGRLDEMIESSRDFLRRGIRAIGGLMSQVGGESVDPSCIVKAGSLLQGLAELDQLMLRAEEAVANTREYLQGGASHEQLLPHPSPPRQAAATKETHPCSEIQLGSGE